MTSTVYTGVLVEHDPASPVATVLGAWRVRYLKHGVEQVHHFTTATAAVTFGADLESGKLDALPGNAPAKPNAVHTTRGPWRVASQSGFGPDYVDIDGGAGITGWRSLASVAVRSEGKRSLQGEANARLIAAAPGLRTALLSVCDAAERVCTSAHVCVTPTSIEGSVTDLSEHLATLAAARNAALALLDVLGVAR